MGLALEEGPSDEDKLVLPSRGGRKSGEGSTDDNKLVLSSRDAAFPIKVRVRVDNRLKVVDCIALLPLHLRNMFGCSQTNLALNKMVPRKKRMKTRSQLCQKKGKPYLVYIFITTDHNILTSYTYLLLNSQVQVARVFLMM